jgi:branched-chain amino acid transport system substrate-binding protein
MIQDDIAYARTVGWETGGYDAMGIEKAYEGTFAYETTDFAPVLTAMLASDPDLLDFTTTYPGWATLLIEQAYAQGWTGLYTHNNVDLEAVLSKVPVEAVEGMVEGYPEFSDPYWGEGSPQHRWADEWQAKHGPGGSENLFRSITPIDWLYLVGMEVWIEGAKIAGTVETDAVITAMHSPDAELDTMLGKAHFWGEEAFGIDNIFLPPVYITVVRDGVRYIDAVYDWEEDYWNENKEHALEVLEEYGVLYWQR